MKWKNPPTIKVYEALGAIGDGRVHTEENEAKVYSSSGNKFYTVTFDQDTSAIMVNDNASYWQGTLGYPAIAFLCLENVVKYNAKLAQDLAGIPWKDINTQFKNDFAKTEKHVKEKLFSLGWNEADLEREVQSVVAQVEKLDLSLLGKKTKPPLGY
jgi:hypothetical protein